MTLTYDDLQFPVYLNSRVVGAIGGTSLTVSDAIHAAQLVRNNVFLAGKKGTGKTQILRDLYLNRYGERGVNLEGRADLKADEVYKTVNLEKLRHGGLSSDELVELTSAADFPFIAVDELNRCPEVTQNELLSMMNGYVIHRGHPVKLGKGFSVGVATGNLGNGGYVGTFRIDEALADRLHLFLDLDYWKPTDEDMAAIDFRRHYDPHVKESPVRDISDKIAAANTTITQRETPFEIMVTSRYLERALDYCMKFPSAGHSKDNLRESWPVICTQKNCELKDTACAQVKAVGERAVQAATRLAQGLQYVACLKGQKTSEDPIGAMEIAIRLMLPYAGVISPAYLRQEGMFNNPNIAAADLAGRLVQEIRDEFAVPGRDGKSTPGPLTVALAYAQQGKLAEHPYQPKDKRWDFVQPHLKRINDSSQAVSS